MINIKKKFQLCQNIRIWRSPLWGEIGSSPIRPCLRSGHRKYTGLISLSDMSDIGTIGGSDHGTSDIGSAAQHRPAHGPTSAAPRPTSMEGLTGQPSPSVSLAAHLWPRPNFGRPILEPPQNSPHIPTTLPCKLRLLPSPAVRLLGHSVSCLRCLFYLPYCEPEMGRQGASWVA